MILSGREAGMLNQLGCSNLYCGPREWMVAWRLLGVLRGFFCSFVVDLFLFVFLRPLGLSCYAGVTVYSDCPLASLNCRVITGETNRTLLRFGGSQTPEDQQSSHPSK